MPAAKARKKLKYTEAELYAAVKVALVEKEAAQDPGHAIWKPLPGPQTQATETLADVTGYGGSAGGGKTDWLIGLALTRHRKSIIFRREYKQLRDIITRTDEIVRHCSRFNGKDNMWRLDDGRTIELGAVQHESDKENYKGRPHDLKAFDELTEYSESQFRFIIGWNRTTLPGQRCRVIATFNPPTSAEGQWVIRYFSPWLDREHPNPALPGELRWYARLGDKDIERPHGKPFEYDGAMITPLSRTFIPARLKDNPFLVNTNYASTLQSMPEPLRSQLLFGDFTIGMDSDPWQVIPLAWVYAANRRWLQANDNPGQQTSAGLDVAHGGKDKTVLAIRHGNWFAPLHKWEGVETPTGSQAAALVYKALEPHCGVNVDAIGYGASAAERLRESPPEGYGIHALPINFAAKSEHCDKSKKYKMINLRAEAYWRLREALDPEGTDPIALPPDQELLADICGPKYEITTSGIKIESKQSVKERLGRSPDCGDAVALAMLPLFKVGRVLAGGVRSHSIAFDHDPNRLAQALGGRGLARTHTLPNGSRNPFPESKFRH